MEFQTLIWGFSQKEIVIIYRPIWSLWRNEWTNVYPHTNKPFYYQLNTCLNLQVIISKRERNQFCITLKNADLLTEVLFHWIYVTE